MTRRERKLVRRAFRANVKLHQEWARLYGTAGGGSLQGRVFDLAADLARFDRWADFEEMRRAHIRRLAGVAAATTTDPALRRAMSELARHE